MLICRLIDEVIKHTPKLIISVGIVLVLWLIMFGYPSYTSLIMYLFSLMLSNFTLGSLVIDKDYDIIEQEQRNRAYTIYVYWSLLCMYVLTIILNLSDEISVDVARYVPLSVVYTMLVTIAILKYWVKYTRYSDGK